MVLHSCSPEHRGNGTIKKKIQEEHEKLNRAIVGIETGESGDFPHRQGDLNSQNNFSGW
jgi:hypothetical protein